MRRLCEVFLSFDGLELELEHLAFAIMLSPGINEMKDAVIRPYALPQLFVNTDFLR